VGILHPTPWSVCVEFVADDAILVCIGLLLAMSVTYSMVQNII
jgi:hypothetical protein